MSLQIRPLSFAVGAAITGVDLAQPLSADNWSAIPTAVITESSENTMSINAICTNTPARPAAFTTTADSPSSSNLW